MEAVVKIMNYADLKKFYKGKRVLVTGHTGFKGSWLSKLLITMGANVYGYSLMPPTEPNLYSILNLGQKMNSKLGDIRDFEGLKDYFDEVKPEVVFHLAAQPIVRDSYKIPRDTYEINVMGTVNILECIRLSKSCISFLNVTTDKVYQNSELLEHSFTEEEKLDGYDPYSNSKSCSELVTHSYRNSFFNLEKHSSNFTKLSTARAGNVIGGGDFANDRIIPDCVRATVAGKTIAVRNPYSIRPYQHVLEPLYVYLLIAMEQIYTPELAGYYNVGPSEQDCITTGELVNYFINYWGGGSSWKNVSEVNAPHEANFLKLDCSKLCTSFHWSPIWTAEEAIKQTVLWYKAWANKENMDSFTERQIESFWGSF